MGLILQISAAVICYAMTMALQGAGKKFPYPKYVWSPAGGWWCNPRHWKRNTVYAFVWLGGLSAVVWYISAQLEVRGCGIPEMAEL